MGQLFPFISHGTYPLISHFSRSKPLCMDCPIEDSMRSTYLITWGAKVSRIVLWNFPFFRLSKRKIHYHRSCDLWPWTINVTRWWGNFVSICQQRGCDPVTCRRMNHHHVRNLSSGKEWVIRLSCWTHRQSGGSRWVSGRAGRCPMCLGAARPAPAVIIVMIIVIIL